MKTLVKTWHWITDAIGRVVGFLVMVALIVFLLSAIYGHLTGTIEPKARAGDSCGPDAHWVWIGPPDPYGDLSCEDDKIDWSKYKPVK